MTEPQATMAGLPESIALDDVRPDTRASGNSALRKRQASYDAALLALVPGGAPVVVRVAGKDTSRGLKLRFSKACARLGLAAVVVKGGTLKSDGAAVVYAHIPAPKK